MYVWQPAFADRSDFEEIIEVEAKEVPAPKAPRAKKPAPVVDEDALFADASRGLP